VMIGRRLRALGRSDGAEIAEAALVLPLVFTFLLGIVWFGRAFNIYSTITQAAQLGARAAARPTCATCAAPTGSWSSSNFPGNAAVESAVFSVMNASSVDPGQIIAAPNPGLSQCTLPPPAPPGACAPTGSNIMVCRAVVLNPTSSPPVCGTVVTFQYPFQFYLPFTSLNLQQITLTAYAQSVMEN